MDEMSNMLSYLEWEFLKESMVFHDVEHNSNLPLNIQSIEVYRDESYQIKARLVAKNDIDFEHKHELNKEDSNGFVEQFDIEGNVFSLHDVVLSHCSIDSFNSTTFAYNMEHEQKLDISVWKVVCSLSPESDIGWFTDWYLNGPNCNFPRVTYRNIQLEYGRLRYGIDELDGKSRSGFSVRSSNGSSKDFAFISTGHIKFLICEVEKNNCPAWSHGIAIEYRNEFDYMPSDKERNAIKEIVSFVLGKELIHVGHTKYILNGKCIEKCGISHAFDNILKLCQSPAQPPIDIESEPLKIESLLNELIPSYINLRDEMNLNSALHYYWAALDAPLGINLPILSSALEILMKGWRSNKKSSDKANYMEKKHFDSLFEEELKLISSKLDSHEFGNRIYNKMKTSYEMSVTDRFNTFFESISLNVGDIEKKAIRSRHGMAHGDHGRTLSDKEYLKMWKCTQAYVSLFNRVFLKILGYDGEYIDWASPNFSNRHIDTPVSDDI